MSFLYRTAAALACCCVSLPAAAGPVDDVRQLDRELAALRNAPAAQREPALRALRARADALASVADVPVLAKLDAVRTALSVAPQARAKRDNPRPVFRYLPTPDGFGTSCGAALGIDPQSSVEIPLGANASAAGAFWLRWEAPSPGHYVITTRASDIDTRLAAFGSCADSAGAPLATADDGIGLQAEIVLKADYAGQPFHIQATNAGAAGTLAVEAVAAQRTLSGRVTREFDGSGVSGINVRAFRAQVTEPYVVGSSTTNSTGAYTLYLYDYYGNAVDPLPVVVRTGNDYYVDPKLVHEAYPDIDCLRLTADAMSDCIGTPAVLSIADGEARTNVDFALDRGLVIDGRVTDGAGAPLREAQVELFNDSTSVRSLTTDAFGRVRFQTVPAGTYYARARLSGFLDQRHGFENCAAGSTCTMPGGTPIELTAASSPSLAFALSPHARIALTITVEGEDEAIHGLYTSVFRANGALFEERTLYVRDGVYEFGPLPPGSYKVRVNSVNGTFAQLNGGIVCPTDCVDELADAPAITIDDSSDIERVAIDLTYRPDLTGRVVEAVTGAPIAGASVRVLNAQGNWVTSGAATLDDGTYRVQHVPTGNYFVQVMSNRHVDRFFPDVECPGTAICAGAESLRFSTTSGDAAADFTLARSGRVTGRITYEDRFYEGTFFSYSEGPRLLNPARVVQNAIGFEYDRTTGTYSLNDVPAGTYYAGIYSGGFHPQIFPGSLCPSGSYYSDNAFTQCSFAGATTIVVPDRGEVTGIDFDMRPGSARPVRVVDAATREPLAGVAVDAWDPSGNPLGTWVTGASGRVYVLPYSGYYNLAPTAYLSTDNYIGYRDMLYPDIVCDAGTSAFKGGCAPTAGALLTFPAPSAPTPDIVFPLGDGDRMFIDDFE